MKSQPVRHLTDIHLTKGTLLLFCALVARLKVPLTVLISEDLSATIRTVKLTHIENISNLSGYLHLLKLLLTERTDRVLCQPLTQTRATDQAFAVGTRREVLQDIRTDWAYELLEDLLEFWPSIVYGKLFEFICRYSSFQPFVDIGDECCGPMKSG